MAREAAAMLQQENSTELLTAFSRIPYALLNAEVEGDAKSTLDEFTEIMGFYKVYKQGAKFNIEGTNGDYIPAQLRHRLAASLINKEARFLFAESPDIVVKPKGDVGKTTDTAKRALTVLNDLVKTVLTENKFEDALIKAARDCFIGKRVAGLVNFNEDDGITVTFLPSLQFLYDTKLSNANVLTKFVCFIVVKDSTVLSDKMIFKKKYVLDGDKVMLEEIMYDGAGKELEVVTPMQETLLTRIPAFVCLNDGLTGDADGESEVKSLADYESWYSKLSNADLDAERKSMNPIKYVVDMDSASTKKLSTSPGALWDLGTDQNLTSPQSKVGMLESEMSYSSALQVSLERIKGAGYEQIDIPNVSMDTMQGAITSGKALKAIYWPLLVRCKEKMKVWGPQLRNLADIIIQGALVYPACAERYTPDPIVSVAYEVVVEQNMPLPEDAIEEKAMDLTEVEARTLSRKSYMQKWRQLTDDEVAEELAQIALERQVLDDSSFDQARRENPPFSEVDDQVTDLDV